MVDNAATETYGPEVAANVLLWFGDLCRMGRNWLRMLAQFVDVLIEYCWFEINWLQFLMEFTILTIL